MQLTIETIGKKLRLTTPTKTLDSPCRSVGWSRKVARDLGLPASFLEASVQSHRVDEATEFDWVSADTLPTSYRVRVMESSDAKSFDTFDKALRHGAKTKDSVIEWEGTGDVAALDVDWHGGTPGPGSLDSTVYNAACEPKPAFAWVTKHGGLRLIYKRVDGVPANVLAAVAAYKLLPLIAGYTGIEIISRTRSPLKFPSDTFPGTPNLEALRGIFTNSSYSTEARDKYLADNSLEIGKRYSHDICPIAKGHKSSSPDPVFVGSSGLFCHSCKARLGRGLVGWAYILGSHVSKPLGVCVKAFTHYEHAEHVLRCSEVEVPEKLREDFYRAALTLVHGVDDTRVENAFRKRDLVRYSGYWGTRDGAARRGSLCEKAIRGLPVATLPDGTINEEIVERFQDTAPLDDWGYFAIKQVPGARFSTLFITPKDGRPRAAKLTPGNVPTYLEAEARLDESIAWERLDVLFPGVHRNVIEMLAFCRGLVEMNAVQMCPMFLFEGASGSGKTGSSVLAAAILGDTSTEIETSANNEDMSRRLLLSLDHGSFAVIDEVMKAAAKYRMSPRTSLDWLLRVSPRSMARRKFENDVVFGGVPVVVVTDNEFTDEVRGDTQLGRRFYHWFMGNKDARWKEANAAAGLKGKFCEEIRKLPDIAQAVDSLYSIWVDRYFSVDEDSIPSADEVAERLGIKKLDSMGAFEARGLAMKRLYLAWASHSAPVAKWVEKLRSKDFKVFDVKGETPLAQAWREVADTDNPSTWSRANDREWASLLGRELPVRLEHKPLRKESSWIQLRFIEDKGGQWVSVK